MWAAMGAAGFGLSMASTYPLAMSLLPEAGELCFVVREFSGSSVWLGYNLLIVVPFKVLFSKI